MKTFIENNQIKLRHCNKNVVNNVLDKAKVAKSWINQLFGIDENIGYKKFNVSIDKVDMLKHYIENNYNYVLQEVENELRKNIKNFIINDITIVDKNKIKINVDIAQNRNRHLYTNKNIELKVTDLHNVSFCLLKKEYMVDEIGDTLHHKIICECKSDIELYIVTNSIAMLFASESDSFSSCHRISENSKYTNGNLQNLLSSNVFAVYRIKDNKLLSRAWIYAKEYEGNEYAFIVSRIYNNSRLTGRHITNLFKKISNEKGLNLEVKSFETFDFYMDDYYGYNDIGNGRKAIYISNSNKTFNKIDFSSPIDLVTGDYYDDYSGLYTQLREEISSCSWCGAPIYEEDDYIVTTSDNYYHSNCDGYWYCERCDAHHDDDIECYEIFTTDYNSYLSCTTDNAFFCEHCHRYFDRDKRDEFQIYTNEYDYNNVCVYCIEKISTIYCESCGKEFETFSVSYTETENGIIICQFCSNEKKSIENNKC